MKGDHVGMKNIFERNLEVIRKAQENALVMLELAKEKARESGAN